ncbi:rhodanese-like domain-containing protein [Aureispira anguillae]|uniref:Rhodanese-like domain-containing protein n=1 Tax=Aureispira anguillae TaxID=2864201 RepID=A0A915YM87_9BACT|nr:rhodanese-like domain-containing protein [Aureispira anguillae]BDS15556.1 rhodanese-like domain-containing protein [Aureispira anguillae]
MNYINMNAQQFKTAIDEDKSAILLDVRTPREVAEGSIEGAKAIDFLAGNFDQKVADFDKDKTYLIYCRSGARSGKACQIMSQLGFTKLVNLEGGILSWNY